jgi:hypothetical protein
MCNGWRILNHTCKKKTIINWWELTDQRKNTHTFVFLSLWLVIIATLQSFTDSNKLNESAAHLMAVVDGLHKHNAGFRKIKSQNTKCDKTECRHLNKYIHLKKCIILRKVSWGREVQPLSSGPAGQIDVHCPMHYQNFHKILMSTSPLYGQWIYMPRVIRAVDIMD